MVMKRYLLIIGILFSFGLFSLICAEVLTEMNILNGPPSLIQNIPNFTWATNENLINAFNLDNYFLDSEGLDLVYSSSSTSNITVLINNSNVSFYPNLNFAGTETVFFYASDGEENSTSNLVYLNVGTDTEPPKYSFLGKSISEIYQNSYVTFSAIWDDNVGLKEYTFSINQGGTWINYTNLFNGIQNLSSYTKQISAGGGSTVYWYFCAKDTSSNSNCSSTQSFVVSTRTFITPPSSSSSSNSDSSSSSSSFAKNFILPILERERVENFTLSVDSFLISLKQGGSATRIIEITNIGNTNLSFNLSFEKTNGFKALLSEKGFTLEAGKSKKITIDFIFPKDIDPGQYFSLLVIDSIYQIKIPLVFEINPLNVDLDLKVNIFEEFKIIKPNEFVKANITISHVNDKIPLNLTLYYDIKDYYGNIYNSKEESILLESSLNLERNLSLFEDFPIGNYLFYARASDEDYIAMNSDSFEVGLKFLFSSFLKSSFIFILVLSFSIFSFLLLLKYKHEKNKEELLELYIKLLELKKLIHEGNYDSAANLFILIKKHYGEYISKDALNDRELLKKEIQKLTKKFDLESKPLIKKHLKEGKEEKEAKSNKEDKEIEESIEEKEDSKIIDEKEIKKNEEGGEFEKNIEEKINNSVKEVKEKINKSEKVVKEVKENEKENKGEEKRNKDVKEVKENEKIEEDKQNKKISKQSNNIKNVKDIKENLQKKEKLNVMKPLAINKKEGNKDESAKK